MPRKRRMIALSIEKSISNFLGLLHVGVYGIRSPALIVEEGHSMFGKTIRNDEPAIACHCQSNLRLGVS